MPFDDTNGSHMGGLPQKPPPLSKGRIAGAVASGAFSALCFGDAAYFVCSHDPKKYSFTITLGLSFVLAGYASAKLAGFKRD